MEFSFKDTLRTSVEAASNGKNTVLYDEAGVPSIMVIVPKFDLSLVGLGSGTHPAFIVNGVEKDEIFISKYQNILGDGGHAMSMPGVDPDNSRTLDDSRASCTIKGRGWHIMTNTEWAAIALWCWKNGTMPRGNNNYGQDIDNAFEHGKPTLRYKDGTTLRIGRCATGSGPNTWYHDWTPSGIADMNGNVWEWNDGLKLVDGRIYVHGTSGVPMNNYETQNAHGVVTGWLDTGLYFDCPSGTNVISNTVTTRTGTVGSDEYNGGTGQPFESTTVASGVTVPAYFKSLCIQPPGSGLGGDYLWVRNHGERICLRGGDWVDVTPSGVFGLNLYNPRTLEYWTIGFRASFIA